MSKIHPFRALRPVSEKVSAVSSVPYDTVNREEAQTLADGNPWSFLRISRAEIDLPSNVNPYSSEVYDLAESHFRELTQKCPLIQEEQEMLYVYRLIMGDHEQTGIFGCFSIDEYDRNLIKKHERTRADKEDDRTRHILKLMAQTGPAFLTYKDVSEINELVEQIKTLEPLYDFTAADQIRHTLWQAPNFSSIIDLFDRKVELLYIADGHHRAAAASRTRAELAKKNPSHRGDEEYNYVLAAAFPSSQVNILPYHRVIKDLLNMTVESFLSRVKAGFEVMPGDSQLPNPGEFGMYLDRKWYRIIPKEKRDHSKLDVTILQDSLLAPILGIQDPRTNKRIDFVGGIRGTKELERLVNEGSASVAFSVHPVTIDDLIAIADQDGIMPPKSTWFEPKLRDGLLSHLI